MSSQHKHQDEVDILVEETLPAELIVHNDDVNTFDWVIRSLVEICDHQEKQAEQCALFIHYKGRFCVKHDYMDKLKPMKDGLTDRGISATIEEYSKS